MGGWHARRVREHRARCACLPPPPASAAPSPCLCQGRAADKEGTRVCVRVSWSVLSVWGSACAAAAAAGAHFWRGCRGARACVGSPAPPCPRCPAPPAPVLGGGGEGGAGSVRCVACVALQAECVERRCGGNKSLCIFIHPGAGQVVLVWRHHHPQKAAFGPPEVALHNNAPHTQHPSSQVLVVGEGGRRLKPGNGRSRWVAM